MGCFNAATKTITGMAALIQNTKDPDLIAKYSRLQIVLLENVTKLGEKEEEIANLKKALKLKESLTPFKSACYVCDDKKNILEGPYCPGCAASKGIACRFVKATKEPYNVLICPNCKIKIRDGYASEVLEENIKTLPAENN